MTSIANLISQCHLNIAFHSDDIYPKVVLSKFTWRKILLPAYKLPNGVLVMSERQLAKVVFQSKQDVQKFLLRNHLQGVFVRIPNGKVIKSYTLPTLAFLLWEYFACHKNRKAIFLLRACAQESIAVRVANKLGYGNNLA